MGNGIVGSSPAHFVKKSTDLRNWPLLHRPRSLPRCTSNSLPCTQAQDKWPCPSDAESSTLLRCMDFKRNIGSWPLATDHLENCWDCSRESPSAGPSRRATAVSSGELLGTTFSATQPLFATLGRRLRNQRGKRPTATSKTLPACASHRKQWPRAPTAEHFCPPGCS